MPPLQSTDDALAVLVSDMHLCEAKPAAIKNDNWLIIQGLYLSVINQICRFFDIPLVIAGDVFDKWNASPKVISLAMDHLPSECYAVPGQHDLPYHNYDMMDMSAYGVLCKAHRITNLEPGAELLVNFGTITGFPWGYEIEECDLALDDGLNINLCVAHQFFYSRQDQAYPGASGKYSKKKLQDLDYQVYHFGDNHTPVHVVETDFQAYNPGGLMIRKVNEAGRAPRIGLLMNGGCVRDLQLHIQGLEVADPEREIKSMKKEIRELQEFVQKARDLGQDLMSLLRDEDMTDTVRKIIVEALSDVKG